MKDQPTLSGYLNHSLGHIIHCFSKHFLNNFTLNLLPIFKSIYVVFFFWSLSLFFNFIFVSFDLIVSLLVEISLNYRSYGLNIYLNILKPCVCLMFIWVHLLLYSSNKSKKNFIYFFPKTLIPNKET
jgi:hypothetical protein